MWYVVQVSGGNEAKACKLISQAAERHVQAGGSKVLEECFVPTYQCEQKFKGEYRLLDRNLFPGYVIAITRDVNGLNLLLRGISAFTKILGSSEGFVPLDRGESAFINSFTTAKHRVIRTSRAVVEGDHVKVMEGPMVGHEGWIKEINRRKGTARIEAVMFGRTINVEVGLAVMSKADERA